MFYIGSGCFVLHKDSVKLIFSNNKCKWRMETQHFATWKKSYKL